MTPLLEVSGVSMRFPVPSRRLFGPRPVVHALDDVSLAIGKGESFGLVGESGSGKSTLAHVVLGLLRPTAGEVRFDGLPVSTLSRRQLRPVRRRLQLVFQDPYSSLNPNQSVGEMLAEILHVHGLAGPKAGRRRAVEALLARVGLPAAAARRYPHEFSGGQRQRIVIARALASGPDLVVADEPVSSLDVSIQAQIVRLIEDLRRDLGLTLLLVAHDLGLVQYMCDRVGVLYLGRLVEVAPAAALFAAPRHPYTEMLLSVVPTIGPRPAGRRIIPRGEIPSPISPPSGCVFRTRCRYARPDCAGDVPALRAVGPGHLKACIRDDILTGGENG